MFLLNKVSLDHIPEVPGVLDVGDISRVSRTAKDFNNSEVMSAWRIRRHVISLFKELQPNIAFLIHGSTHMVSPTCFYGVRRGDVLTSLHYKISINTDGKSLEVRRYDSILPGLQYQMKIELCEKTTHENFIGRLYCTCFDSEEYIIADFKYMRRSPALFHQVLQYIREKGIKAYRFDMFSNH
jgi:hypothetical protein